MGFRAAAAAVAVFAAAVLAVANGDSLADLGGAAREIESAPGTTSPPPASAGDLCLVVVALSRFVVSARSVRSGSRSVGL